jgi:propanediol dehydratase small subunit
MDDRLTPTAFDPVAERPTAVRTPSGPDPALTVEAVLEGRAGLDDIRITPDALRRQAEIARSAGRETLAENFERAAELALMPQDELLATYEMLRPGRAGSASVMLTAAARLKEAYGAVRVAALIEEAADTYEVRGLFTRRY